jgi:hypothetical protein
MQALEQGTVATDDNRQRHHCQLRWTQSKPSLIMMDKINTIIVKRQSAHKMSVSLMQQGEPWRLALEPQNGLTNERNKGIVRTL